MKRVGTWIFHIFAIIDGSISETCDDDVLTL